MEKKNVNTGLMGNLEKGFRLFIKAEEGLLHLLMGIIILVGELALMFAFGMNSL